MTAGVVASGAGERTLLAWTALAGVVLMFLVLASSGYMRLAASGYGCDDWPACFGNPSRQETQPLHRIARPLHRLAASGMGAAAVLAVGLAWVQRPRRAADLTIALTAFALTVFLAVLGRMARSFLSPAVIIGNVVAGTLLLLLLWWLFLRARFLTQASPDRAAGWAAVAFALGLGYFALNALANVHHALPACPTLADCAAAWREPAAAAFNPLRALEAQLPPAAATASRRALGLAQLLSPALLLAAACLLLVGLSRAAAGLRRLAFAAAAGVLAQAAVAVFGVRPDFPFAAMLAHDLLGIGALLLLAALGCAAAHSRVAAS
jgi:cytochrome c oxidase assembly protein subunit 15